MNRQTRVFFLNRSMVRMSDDFRFPGRERTFPRTYSLKFSIGGVWVLPAYVGNGMHYGKLDIGLSTVSTPQPADRDTMSLCSGIRGLSHPLTFGVSSHGYLYGYRTVIGITPVFGFSERPYRSDRLTWLAYLTVAPRPRQTPIQEI